MRHCYVVDTGYLLALYEVPNSASPAEFREVQRRFMQAAREQHAVLVPAAVIFELGRHLAHLPSRGAARGIAQSVLGDLRAVREASLARIYSVEPLPDLDALLALFEHFADETLLQGHSLTDAAVVKLAKEQKALHSTRPVYIWTWERKVTGIRAHSPDAEADPFPQ